MIAIRRIVLLLATVGLMQAVPAVGLHAASEDHRLRAALHFLEDMF